MVNHTGRCKELHGKGECNPPQHTYTHKKKLSWHGKVGQEGLFTCRNEIYVHTTPCIKRSKRNLYVYWKPDNTFIKSVGILPEA